MPRLPLIGVSRPTGINSVVRKTNRLAVIAETPSHALKAERGGSSCVVIFLMLQVADLRMDGTADGAGSRGGRPT
ncbi:hypothetical protein Plo01_72710 [Planobispora longispora]|uniref:Uncharacterized protein n=1 Tax=Planobispora longispora TaxID=28887 RepID=A0A8J3RS74_9ACTN|nr:hypothetical protein Plo01_72710 [Planobispora longispora]